MSPTPNNAVASPNFAFLAKHDALLVRYGAQAERYVFDDPNTALIKLRQFSEVLAKLAAAQVGVYLSAEDGLTDVLSRLRDSGVLNSEVAQLFHALRKAGNAAAHEHRGTQGEALHQLRMARTLGIWFHRAFGNDKNFKAGPFVPPPDPAQASQEIATELERLRQEAVEHQAAATSARQTAAEEARQRAKAETEAKAAYDELAAALALAEESEARATAEKRRLENLEQELAKQQAAAKAASADQVQAKIKLAVVAGDKLDLDEAATRRLIDVQLVEAGWEADSQSLSHKKGVRPQKGRNLAIAEWPTANGPADYVLFNGLTPLAVVEAKRKSKDVPASIEQAKRYSRGYKVGSDEVMPGGPWDKYKIPFLFATNGRPYLKQIKTKSGIWFLDGRSPSNNARPLETWYTPTGLGDLLKQDLAAAEEQLQQESADYLPLREYQKDAIRSVEDALAKGRRELLLAMATGTGKTRTCIGIVYRLIKAKRFRRVLFLVDRTALGEQASNAFKDVKLENYQSFTEIYDVKELGDLVPDDTTKLQFATIQGMVKRVLYPGDDPPPPADWYDCIVVDECHRGYNLDLDMSDAELNFRSEQDYISKYSRVLDHFDAVKIGLTATPALHTTELFGGPDRLPIFQYSYRQAVIDGYLVDHEPPFRIFTELAEDGMHWRPGETMKLLHTKTATIELFVTPDDVDVEVEEFNRRVITEPFNRVVCKALAEQIDPSLPGKTLIFCATDSHADMVVGLLKEAFTEQYGSVEDDAVVKITGASDKPMQLIRKFKNERLPNVAVTVDLLTTGIDVPEIVNLVFIRRVRSRILYEQMLGRATRLCEGLFGEGQPKERFMVYDAVDLYSALEPYTSMKPVVTQPNITFGQLVTELSTVTDPAALQEIKEQLVAKLQQRKRKLKDERLDQFKTLTGTEPGPLLHKLHQLEPKQIAAWFNERPTLVEFLDARTGDGDPTLIVSDAPDSLRRTERGYGTAKKPGDYLESFREFITTNINLIPALLVVTQRPRDLTRKQLRELMLQLDQAGFSETALRTAWRETTNQDIAATIIGHIRHAATGSPLVPYKDRVAKAMQKILSSRPWNPPQRKWLERIGKQLEVETIVDREALDRGEFQAQGGFTRLNKIFDGHLEELLHELTDTIWMIAA
jgi:type I restriction enzyme R subunit